jgi:flagellar biosynthesis/type III secretory pathway protein FliH
MPQTIKIQLEKPITSAGLLDAAAGHTTTASPEIKQTQTQELHKTSLIQACKALQDAANKINEFQENLFKQHKEQIAKLSVEIARKILAQKVQQGDYQIETIVKNALENAPTHQDIVVHLNPEDLIQCQKLQKDDATGALAGIKLTPDQNIGRAECTLETPKGIIKSLIEQHLEQIAKALKTAE